MPELPEVETVRRILNPLLEGRYIEALSVHRPEVLAHPLPEAFTEAAIGKRIHGLGRRGKFLLIHLPGGGRIIVHLRMTGQLLVAPQGFPLEKHTHVVFHLSDGNELRFVDLRRFGRLWLQRPGEADTFSGLQKLGPEPFDAVFGAEMLEKALSRRRRPLKECLLDQSVIAGIGNIYADEILFAARLRPDRPASGLSMQEWARLAAAIPDVLRRGIEANDMTPEAYLEGRGREYRAATAWQVYGRAGKPCPRCGAPLARTVIAGRGSCYCAACQKG